MKDLQEGIVTLFADGQRASKYRADFGELPGSAFRPARTSRKGPPKEAWQCAEKNCQRAATKGPRGGRSRCDRCRAQMAKRVARCNAKPDRKRRNDLRNRADRATNREKHRAYTRKSKAAWNERNPGRASAYFKAWYEQNKARLETKRRAKQLDQGRSATTILRGTQGSRQREA